MKTQRALSLLFVAGLFAGLPVWASSADTAKSVPAKSATSNDNTTNAAASLESSNYKLRPTDVIGINVADDARASGEFKIDIDGTVLLTYLPEHPVKVVGLSTAKAAELIIKTYKEQQIFVNPSITVSIKAAAPRYINFIGQVMRQGKIEIPISKEMTLSFALSEAGGPTSKADRYVTISRINPDKTITIMKDVDLLAAVKQGKDVPLQEGDTITLGESTLGDVWH